MKKTSNPRKSSTSLAAQFRFQLGGLDLLDDLSPLW
jgi:hypothetical protein